MRKTLTQLCLGLLLVPILTLALLGSVALAAPGDTGSRSTSSSSTGGSSNGSNTTPPAADTITLVNKGPFTIEPTNTSTAEIKVNVTGNSQVQWKVKDYVNGEWGEYGANSDIVLLNPRSNGTTCTVSGRKPGKVLIRAYLDNGAETEEISVEVSGIDVSTEPIEVMENEEKELWPATAYGEIGRAHV